MPHKTFFAFILPSLIAMLLFIALPIVSVVVQSLHVEHSRVLVEVQTCQPFGGCTTETRVDTEAMEELRREQPMGQFNGLGTYLNRGHLAVNEVGEILANNNGLGDVVTRIYNLPFYKALAFTLVFCFVVTPLAILFTDPNIVSVGAPLRDLDASTIAIGEVDFARQGRARVMAKNRGKLRVYGDRATGRLLGACLCAPAGEHMGHLLAWCIQQGLTVFDLQQMPYYHPVLEEGLRTAIDSLARSVEARADSAMPHVRPARG